MYLVETKDKKKSGSSGKHIDYSSDDYKIYTSCEKSFICTKDNTCSMYEGECMCIDEAADMPVCANPDCGEYCGGGSECKNNEGVWGCNCLPSFNLINGKCVKKQECKKPDAIVGPVGFAVDNTRSMCHSLDGAKELAKSLADELEGKNVPNWVLVTFTVVRPQTNNIKRNTKLVIDTPDVDKFISSVNGISCSGGSPDGTTRAMQGLKRLLDNMPKGGTVVLITDNKSFDLNLAPKLLKIKEEKELTILIALAPKYHGKRFDETWNKYVKLSSNHIFQMDQFDKKAFLSAAVTEVENTCGNDEIQKDSANVPTTKRTTTKTCSKPCTGGALCKKRKRHSGYKCKCKKYLKYKRGKCVPKCRPRCRGSSKCFLVDGKPKCICRLGLNYRGGACTVICNPKCGGGSVCRLEDNKPKCVCRLGLNYQGGKCVKLCTKSDAKYGPVGFTIDSTSSMGGAGAKGAMGLTTDLVNAIGKHIPQWVLVTFTDQTRGPSHPSQNTKLRIITKDKNQLISSVNSIYFDRPSSRNPDYPERLTQGLQVTLDKMPDNGVVVVITDSGSCDLGLVDNLIRLRDQKKAKIFIVLSPSYKGIVGDASWQAYQRLAPGRVYNLASFDLAKFKKEVVQVVENTCT